MIRQFGGFKIRRTPLPYKLSYLPPNLYTDGKERLPLNVGESHWESLLGKQVCNLPLPGYEL